jgi:hypothetical protein
MDNNNTKYVIGIIMFLLCIYIIMQYKHKKNNESFVDDYTFNSKKLHKIDTNICNRQCCKFTQWPVPFNTVDPKDKDLLKDYIPSNFYCNNGPTGGGCVCIKKDDYKYLGNHGQK